MISSIFKSEDIHPNQLNGKNALEINKEDIESQPEIEMTEDEAIILEILREFTNTRNFDLLIDNYKEFDKLSDCGYSILLENNFFGFFANYIGDSMGRLRTSNDVNQALDILLCFSRISSDVTEQILGNFNHILNYYLHDVSEVRDLSLLLCINFSTFPTIANSEYFNFDNVKISYLSTIYKYSSHTSQRHQVIEIYKNLAKIDIHQYDLFVQSVFYEKYMDDILPLTSTMKLLRYLGKKSITDEHFSNQLFIEKLKNALCLNIEKQDQKYVKNCLKFINIRCSNCLESVTYYDNEFAVVFSQLPDDFLDYISLIYIGIVDKVPESINDSVFLDYIIQKLDMMAHTGNYSHKMSAIKLISKMINKNRDLSHNETILNIIIDSFELLLSFDLLTVLNFLDLLILVCQWERDHEQSIVIDKLISNKIPELLNEISDNMIDLTNENIRKITDSVEEIPDSCLIIDRSNITNRIQKFYNLIFLNEETES